MTEYSYISTPLLGLRDLFWGKLYVIIIIIINTAHVECKNKGETSNNRVDWDYFKVIQKICEQIPGKHEVKELQKTTILGTAHILRKVLM